MTRSIPLALTAVLTVCALGACTSTGSDSGLSQQFDASNFRRSDNTNGTQTRPDVNRAFTQPSMPSIINRGN